MEFYFLLLAAVAVSLALRIQEKNRSQAHQLPEHAKSSPLSQALQEMVATAGGIYYLSLVLLASFLQISLDEKWLVFGTKMEPLAFMALVLAILQPLLKRLYYRPKWALPTTQQLVFYLWRGEISY